MDDKPALRALLLERFPRWPRSPMLALTSCSSARRGVEPRAQRAVRGEPAVRRLVTVLDSKALASLMNE